MSNLDIYCVTNEKLSFLEKTPLKLVGVGKEKFSEKYLKCDNKKNIYGYCSPYQLFNKQQFTCKYFEL